MYLCVHTVTLLAGLYVVEGRVFCQNSRATQWMQSGYTCPVVCQSIINAIERLKIMDFEYMIELKAKKRCSNKFKNTHIEKKHITASKQQYSGFGEFDVMHTLLRRDPRRANQNQNLTSNDVKAANDTNHYVQLEDVMALAQVKAVRSRCGNVKKDGLLGKMMMCARKSNYDDGFLHVMTKMLNKYAKSNYTFTELMTEVLLNSIFVKSTELRSHIVDVNKLLRYLSKAIRVHRENESQGIISLRPVRCMSIALPGCFCRPGFVENDGQCIKPSECVEENSYASYLARVVVL